VFFIPGIVLHRDYHRWRGPGSDGEDKDGDDGLIEMISESDPGIPDVYKQVAELEGEK